MINPFQIKEIENMISPYQIKELEDIINNNLTNYIINTNNKVLGFYNSCSWDEAFKYNKCLIDVLGSKILQNESPNDLIFAMQRQAILLMQLGRMDEYIECIKECRKLIKNTEA